MERVASAPPNVVNVSVDGEWTFAQTLRHLIMATDTWLGGAILRIDRPYHPIGQPNTGYEIDGHDMSLFSTAEPSYARVLEVREQRVGIVRDFLASITPDDLTAQRINPWEPERAETVRSCLQTVLEEESAHLRYATRDLDSIVAGA